MHWKWWRNSIALLLIFSMTMFIFYRGFIRFFRSTMARVISAYLFERIRLRLLPSRRIVIIIGGFTTYNTGIFMDFFKFPNLFRKRADRDSSDIRQKFQNIIIN